MKKRVARDSRLWNLLKHSANISRCVLALDLKGLFLCFRRDILKNGIFVFKEQLPSASLRPVKILDKVLEHFRPASVLDLGCGTGKSLDYFLAKGTDALGVEGSAAAIAAAANPGRILLYNLERELELHRKFDLVWSFEFVEHIDAKYVDGLMKTFSVHSDTVVLSAAKPGQGGDGHFNLQPQAYWIGLFEKKGYRLNDEFTKVLQAAGEKYAENMMVFERRAAPDT